LLSLIIPTYNERKNIVPLIRRVTSTLKAATDDFEIIVVDDDSPDGTWQVAEELAKENSHLRVIRRQDEKGLATAVVAGWKVAKGEILGVMDGDLQHPPETLPELLKSIINTHADIVVASRHVYGGGVSEWSLIRRFVSWTAASIATLALPVLLRAVRDPMSGYFLIKCSVIESISLKPQGYKILLEVLARGKYQTVVEVPYIFEERKEGGSKLGPKQYLEFIAHIGHLAGETGQIGCSLRFCTVGLSGVFVNKGALRLFTKTGGLYHRLYRK
jgi:dolichol-phosphate mannosyltransferase